MTAKKVLVMNLNQGAEYQQLLDGKPQTDGMRSGRVFLEPGKSIGEHSTRAHEEILVFLAGKLLCDGHLQHRLGSGGRTSP